MSNRKVDIIQYLPPFMREYLQLKLITSAENKILDYIYAKLNDIENNQYVLTADETGIQRFEKILGIISDANQDLETRRYKVLSKMSTSSIFTLYSLRQRLDEICGIDNYDLEIDYDKYTMDLTVHIGQHGMIEVLYELLSTMLPANIEFTIKNELNVVGSIDNYSAGSFSTKKSIVFKEE